MGHVREDGSQKAPLDRAFAGDRGGKCRLIEREIVAEKFGTFEGERQGLSVRAGPLDRALELVGSAPASPVSLTSAPAASWRCSVVVNSQVDAASLAANRVSATRERCARAVCGRPIIASTALNDPRAMSASRRQRDLGSASGRSIRAWAGVPPTLVRSAWAMPLRPSGRPSCHRGGSAPRGAAWRCCAGRHPRSVGADRTRR